ncbi:MAG: tRNA glutamyl-Q(34) synthetase GluQRS [Spongiibacteraceae bacterium]
MSTSLFAPRANFSPNPDYIGRFAPSPTGPLHFGSLISALASYLDARAHHGRWLLRIEDIDPLREQPDATAAILNSLRRHGLIWDGDVLYQSQRLAIYHAAAIALVAEQRAFYCTCSRTQLAAQRLCQCREQYTPPTTAAAIRLRVAPATLCFDDAVQGNYCESVDQVAGDFVIFRKQENRKPEYRKQKHRREQLPAYQLAVVVDDAAQGVTHVVRGCDLLDNTARQMLLQQNLHLPTPQYAHIPVIANAQGQKLSKQTFARALNDDDALGNLSAALDFLGQPSAPVSTRQQVRDLLDFATAAWSLSNVPRVAQLSGAALPSSCQPFAA